MRILFRYILVQIPGWIFLGCLLWWGYTSGWIAFTTAGWIMTAWVVKDALLYPLSKPAYEDGPRIGPETLIGRETETIMPLAPTGLVKLDGENWSAHSAGDENIAAGRRIRVTGVQGLTLIVEPAE